MRWKAILFFSALFMGFCFSAFSEIDSSKYDFVRFDANHITTHDTGVLNNFYAKLRHFSTERDKQIRIIQIGDSHVQSGMWGSKTEKEVKAYFKDTVWENGFIFPYRVARTYSLTDFKVIDKWGDWSRCRNVFRHMKCGWGLSGFTATTTSKFAGFELKTDTLAPFNYIAVFHDTLASQQIELLPESSNVLFAQRGMDNMMTEIGLGRPTRSFKLNVNLKEGNEFKLRGLFLGNDKPCIVYNELGVNGAEVPSFLYSPHLPRELGFVNPDLIILSLGVNDTYSSAYNDSTFHKQYDSLLAVLRRSAPNADIILTTPGDCKRFRKYVNKGNISARKSIIELAAKYNCAVWDWFSVMGGLGSVENWYRAGLANKDKLHLLSTGYGLQGELMAGAILEGYEHYLETRPIIEEREERNWMNIFTWFKYDSSRPLLFSSYIFLVLFTLFYTLFLAVYRNLTLRSVYLMLFSLYFYYMAGGYYFVLLLVSTVIDYFIGNKVYKSTSKRNAKWWVTLSLVANLGLLAFFKYSYFAIDLINDAFGTSLEVINWFAVISNGILNSDFDTAYIFLPIGISFYTFQTISYTIDIYRKKVKPVKNIADFAFFVSFFPQLVAGPIVRAADFVPQIYQKFKLSTQDFGRAITLIILGLIKKALISDYISVNYVDRVFDDPTRYSGFENLLAAYGYNIQIFCDFSGYSDMAIGMALLLGFRLPKNFNAPFRALDITDFWRRWHMSLSSWLRDYLYIPLGGNRKGKGRTYFNLLMTMFLGGLWHGASLRFLVWGAAHGFALAIHKLWMTFFGKGDDRPLWFKFLTWFTTFHFVVVTFMLFRAPTFSQFWVMLKQIGLHLNLSTAPQILVGYGGVLSVMLLGYLIHFIPDSFELKLDKAWVKMRWIGVSMALSLVIFIVYQFRTAGVQPFIYFQF